MRGVVLTGDSSKENSPRPDTDVVPAKEIAPASAAEKKLKRKEDKNMGKQHGIDLTIVLK